MPCELFYQLQEGWHARSWLLRVTTVVLVLSTWLLVTSIISHSWAVTEDGVHVGVFCYLIRSDIQVPEDTAPFLYAILAVIALIVLLCDVILDILFITKSFYLVIPTLIVFSFIAGCMTSTVVILWVLGHRYTTSHLAWSFYLAAASALLDYTAFVLCSIEFRLRGFVPRWHWDSTERLATETLEREILNERSESTV